MKKTHNTQLMLCREVGLVTKIGHKNVVHTLVSFYAVLYKIW